MSTKKVTSLDQLKSLAQRTKNELDALGAEIDQIVTAGGEPNKIDEIKVNGVAVPPDAQKVVDITVPQNVSDLTNDAEYQTATQVSTTVQAAIAATGHAHFEKADAVPDAGTAEENILYLVMNAATGHYDIYALVDSDVVLIDDTAVDLTAYSTTEQMNAAITAAVDGLKNGDIATIQAAVDALEAVGATKVAASTTNGNILVNDVETTVYTLPETVLQDANVATDVEVNTMLDEVFAAATP